MTDSTETNRPLRKILGMNSQIPQTGQSNLYYSDNTDNFLQQPNSFPTSMDRMRLANIINQDMQHSVWPYGPFLSPVLPTANLAVPYTLTPSVPYAAVPLYQTIANGAGATGGSNSQQHSTQPNSNREPNRMLIQIGLQCVNQNNPVNINSMNDLTASAEKLNNLNFDQADDPKKGDLSPGSKEKDIWSNVSSSNRKSASLSSGGSTFGAGDPFHSQMMNEAKFEELKTLALTCSEIAEKIAYTHRNRPCFKKIDSLCARMKQDLIRPDGVLPNINSQGIAWAVKDLIFVCTRVINAWIIIKGYVHKTPEGLNKVRSAFDPNFERNFAAWQDTTVDFIESCMQSFVNLDNMVQAQKNVYQKPVNTTPVKCGSDDSIDFLNSSMESISKDATMSKNYMHTMVEDSDDIQRQNDVDGSYFKTGTYNFVPKGFTDEDSVAAFFNENFSKSLSNICGLSSSQMALDELSLNCDIRVLEKNLSKLSSAFDPKLSKPLGKDLVDKLNIFINRLMSLKSADVFFKTQFCRNYFPDFISKTPDFVDLRTIVLKCQAGGYAHIFEVVHDIKLIIYQVRRYIQKQPHPELEKAGISFDADLKKVLAGDPFKNYEFEHIHGKPNEVLYNTGK